MDFSRSQAHSNQPREPEKQDGPVSLPSTASSSTVSPTATLHAATPQADSYEVFLEPADNPQKLPLARRWLAVICIATAAICVTCASSMAAAAEGGVRRQFHVSKETSILGVSLFVLGLGIGPIVAGPMSEIYGRSAVYRVSFSFFFAFMFPVAFAPNIAVYLIFRFLDGFSGAAFLSIAGGSVSDMFSNSEVATPMAVYTVCPFLGPEIGPVFSGFINQHLDWRWTYRLLIIWSFVQAVALILVVPETCIPVILKWKAQRLRKTTGDPKWYAPMEAEPQINLARKLLNNCWKPFYFVMRDHMLLLLNTWNALILGILYLTFQAFPIIFEGKHGFNMQSTGMTFLGMASGMIIGLCTQPYWNRYKDAHGQEEPPPEFRLRMGQVGGVLVPISLFWLAFTTYRGVHWIVPVIASVPFGTGTYFIFTSSFTYIVVAHRSIAAFALTCNTTMRTTFAAAFPLFAGQMYNKLGTVGATVLLAALTTVMAPLPFVLDYMGNRTRRQVVTEKA
ncbi:major facilitator superfamily domain-containing protein [Lactarius psammicola]|nr:major facilitator superfamily domain-containing protein [Lactarius psammicola]